MDKNTKLIIGAVAGLYLLNLTAGIIEFIPDITPFLGNIDEGVAAVIFWQAFMPGKKIVPQ